MTVMTDKEDVYRKMERRIAVAAKREPADLVVKNGKIVNVFTGTTMEGDVAIVDGYFAGIGVYEGRETLQADGKYIVPGLIDGHVHIESSMLAPPEFAKILLSHGVTTAITDPHEIGNAAGTAGLDYMLACSESLPLDIFVMLPSCVPATPFETGGATLEAADLAPYYAHPRVLGLAEVMNYPAVANGEAPMLNKLAGAQPHLIDGHAAGVSREGLNVYMASGIRTDHEGVTLEEAQARLDLGMYLMIREGTVAKNLDALLPAVTPGNARRCLFVTDDKLPDELSEEGSVDHIIRLAVARGLDPVTAIRMATIHAAECYGLRDRGAIAAGYAADFLLVDDLASLKIEAVYKRGMAVVEQERLVESAFTASAPFERLAADLPRMNAKPTAIGDLAVPLSSASCNVIEIIPNQIVTRHLVEDVEVRNGSFLPSTARDQLKLAVIERHHATGNIGLGIVKGFGLRKGAIASSVSHDSHNIVVVGTSDEDMLAAIEQVVRMNGGLAVVADRETRASLALPIAGLMTDRPHGEVNAEMKRLNAALTDIGAPGSFNPFLTLSFLTLPVIPALKLTDHGLFDFEAFKIIPVQADQSH